MFIPAATALAAVAVYVMRRRIPHNLGIEQRTLIATNFGFFTTLYTFFLGFAVIILWQSFNDAQNTVAHESDLLLAQYRLSHGLSHADKFRAALKEYVDFEVREGWPRLAAGAKNDGGDKLYEALWRELDALRPAPGQDVTYFTHFADHMVELDALRAERLSLVDGSMVGPLWAIIFIGVIFTVFSFYFIDARNHAADIFYITIMLTMILGNIFLIYELNEPFSGLLAIGPEKFMRLADKLATFTP